MAEQAVSNANSKQMDYELWGLLARVYKLIGRARGIELSKYGLSPEHSHVLHILINRDGSASLKEIAKMALIQHNTASVLVRKMEKLGLVERKRKEGTNEYEVSLTQSGKEMATVPRVSIEIILDTLSAEEKHSLAEELGKLDQQARHVLGLDYLPPF